MSYSDHIAELSNNYRPPSCWRFWYFDGDRLRSPFSQVVDENGTEVRMWTGRINLDQFGNGYYYVSGTDRFIKSIRPAMRRFRSNAESRDDAAIVVGKVIPDGILGQDTDVPPMEGAMRASSLTIAELFVIHPGRHTNAIAQLRRRYRVPTSTRDAWDSWS